MNATQLTDEDLIARFARAKDRECAAALAERYQTPIYDLAFRMLRNAADAADATQSTFLNALRGARQFHGKSSFKTWLYSIAIHESLRIQNQRKRTQQLERPMEFEDHNSPARDAERAGAMAQLQNEVGALPADERAVVLLHYFRGLSYAETAGALGCASGTVGSRLASARERLRSKLGALGFAAAMPQIELLLRETPAIPAPAHVRAEIASLAAATAPAAAISAWGAWAIGGVAATAAAVAGIAITSRPRAEEKPIVASNFFDNSAPDLGASPSEALASAVPTQDSASSREAAKPEATIAKPAAKKSLTFRATGTVLHERTGEPVTGMGVGLYRVWPPMPIAQTKLDTGPLATTDAKGMFTLTDESPGPAVYRLELRPRSSLADVMSDEFLARVASRAATASAPTEEQRKALRELWAPPMVFEALESIDARADFRASKRDPSNTTAGNLEASAAIQRALRNVFRFEGVTSICGIVQTEDGSHPAETTLRVFDTYGQTDWQKTIVGFDPVSGEFCAGPLPAGTARVEAIHQEKGHAVIPNISLRERTQVMNLVLTLRRGNATLRGEVVDPDGRPIAGASVEVFSEDLLDGGSWMPSSGSAKTNKDGAFQIENAGISGELLRLHLHAEGFRASTHAHVVVGRDSLRFTMKRPALVRGKVVAKDTGRPLPNTMNPFAFLMISVHPMIDAMSRIKGAQFQTAGPHIDIDAEGNFSTESAPGEVNITIERTGYKTVVKSGLVTDDGLDIGLIELEPVPKKN